jgi:hypothetical protein
MTRPFDDFSKSLAEEPVSRRETFRLFGAALAGALLGPLGLQTARAGPPDACTAFCNKCPKSRRSHCLVSCRACNNDPRRLCGHCWGFTCCDSGEACCGNTCHDLASDFDHCGACYDYCDDPGPYENGACIDGQCEYWCVEGAVVCNGECSVLDWDRNNCGACGNVCPDATPMCDRGTCIECPGSSTNCGGYCTYLATDPFNCGACGFVCPGGSGCADGECYSGLPVAA